MNAAGCASPTFGPPYQPQLDPDVGVPPGPAHVSVTLLSHDSVFQIYQTVLRGCEDLCILVHSSVEPDAAFMDGMVSNTP